jgi:signal transduction histidine kinase
VVRREAVLSRFWGVEDKDYFASRSLDVFIKKIRTALEDEPGVELKTIFNRFERAAEHERDARKTRGGFGIGLNYVLQVINAHGGKVSVKSEKGKWSEFTISLPK